MFLPLSDTQEGQDSSARTEIAHFVFLRAAAVRSVPLFGAPHGRQSSQTEGNTQDGAFRCIVWWCRVVDEGREVAGEDGSLWKSRVIIIKSH